MTWMKAISLRINVSSCNCHCLRVVWLPVCGRAVPLRTWLALLHPILLSPDCWA